MGEAIPERFHDLFDGPNFATFATVMPAGTPHQTVVWIDRERRDGEDRVLVNTERGRQKERNVQRNPLVGANVIDPDDPYRYVSVRGRVTAVTAEGADEHADALARQYLDIETYPNREEEDGERVIVRVEPLRVTGTAPG